MAKIEKSIVIDAPVEDVFNYVEEPTNIPEYWPSVVEIKEVEQLPNGGARMTAVYKMAGVRFDVESECTEYVPATWIYEPHDGGTKVTVENEYTVQLPVLQKLAESFLIKVKRTLSCPT